MACDHPHHHGHQHAHGMTAEGFDRAMVIGVGLNTGFVAVELGFGLWGGSLALLADAGHNAGDVVGLLLAWGASLLARRPPSRRFTFGLRRVTIYAAFANAVLLLAACGAILWEAVQRFREPAPVAGLTMVLVAAIGVVINTATAVLFMRGSHGDANVRGAFLHMAADAAVSVGVVVAGLAIMATGLGWIDPLVSIVIMAVIVWGTWDLFTESLGLAMDAVPRRIDVEQLTASLVAIEGVREVHDLHVWSSSTSEVILTAHLVVPEGDRQAVLTAARSVLAEQFTIAHVTLQLEGEAIAAGCPQRDAATL